MKILLLNSKINAKHKMIPSFERRGIVILFSSTSDEAWQMLQIHGDSLDAAVIHRENAGSGKKNDGLSLVSKIKGDPSYAELPLILTTSELDDAQCAEHQVSSGGVNAYLHDPFTEDELIGILEAVFGDSFPPISGVDQQKFEKKLDSNSSGKTDLIDMSSINLHEESGTLIAKSGFQLDAPDFGNNFSEPPTANSVSGNQEASISQIIELPQLTTTNPSIMMEPIDLEQTSVTAPTLLSVQQDDVPKAFDLESLTAAAPEEVESFGEVKEEVIEMPAELPLELPSDLMTELPVDEKPTFDEKPIFDRQAEEEMPYLYGSSKSEMLLSAESNLYAEPLGDAVVPGGIAQTPDLETFKKYLLLREQDVAILSVQLKEAKDQIFSHEKQLREEKAKNIELMHLCQEQKKKLDEDGKIKKDRAVRLEEECNELRFQLRSKTDHVKVIESQAREISQEMEQLKERVRIDIRKIRIREKELENRLEIVKKDSEALIGARENKVIELKRKLDLLEFNMDLLQDQLSKEKETCSRLRERMGKLAQVMRLADGLLELEKLASASELNTGQMNGLAEKESKAS